MARDTMDGQVTTGQGRNGLAVSLRALAAVTLVSALLAGCSTPVERATTAMGPPGASDTQAITDQTHRFVSDAPKADPVTGGNNYHADTFPCLTRPADCRVRDLRTPWEERRYLMPDGTLSAPPGSETPR